MARKAGPQGEAPPRSMVLLAGGDNARMEALRGTIYKAFLPIHGMSLIARHVLRASAYGISAVNIIVDAFDPALPLLARHEPAAVGEPVVEVHAHRGSQAEKLLWWYESAIEERVLTALGDTLAAVDLHELWCRSMAPGFDSSIAIAELQLPFGVVGMLGERVTSFQEKPSTGVLVNTGYMVLGPLAFRFMRENASMVDVLERLAAEGVLGGVICPGPITALDSLESLGEAHRTFAESQHMDETS